MKPSLKMDMFQFVSLHIRALKFSGIWFFIPYANKSIRFWISLLYRILVSIFVFILPTAGQIIFLFKLIVNDGEVQEIASIINLVLTELLTSFKFADLCLRRRLIMKLLKEINDGEFSSAAKYNLEPMERSMRLARRLYIILLTNSTFDVCVHVIVVPALRGFKTLPLKMEFVIFDINEYFEYIFAYQILYKPLMVLTFATLQSLPWAFMMWTIGQLDVLIYQFENMKELIKAAKFERNCEENEAFKSIFTKCVRHHCVIKRFAKTLQATFSGQFSATLALSACIICTTAVQIFSIESPLNNIVELFWVWLYLTVFISILYVDCFLGNYITLKSGRVSNAVYNCPWVDLAPALKKNVLIVITEIQRPLVIMAANNLVPVSLETFTKVMNWTYKGYALMNQMKS